MVVAELRPILEIYDTDIEKYALQAHKMYINYSKMFSFYHCAETTLRTVLGESVMYSISDEEKNCLISLMADEMIKKLTQEKENK
jgi:membrane protein CcdC involved in cytochrome C biogenesis